MMKKLLCRWSLCTMLLACLLCVPSLAAEGDFVIQDGVLKNYTGTATQVVVPAGVTEIGSWAFGSDNITSVTLPEGLKTIKNSAFTDCEKLVTVKMPDSVTTIERFAFEGCPLLKNITLPASLTTLGDYAFSGCRSITSVTVPSGVTVLPIGVFELCDKMTSVTLPNTLIEIKWRAFSDCLALKSITIPHSVTKIDSDAFFYVDLAKYEQNPLYYKAEPRKDLVIYGLSGGEVESHAMKHGYKFVSTGTPTTPTVGGFRDVPEDKYYAQPVLWAVENGITSGTTADTFSPSWYCTRGQILTFLWRAMGSPEAANPCGFADVSEDRYYYKAICWAAEQGIATAYNIGLNTFNPDHTCTRAMAVEFIWRANGSPEAEDAGFQDVRKGGDLSKAVGWAVSQNVTNGTSDTTFTPDNPCTRGQIITFLWRALAQ